MVDIRNKGATAERAVINIFLGSITIIEDNLIKQGHNIERYSKHIQRNSLQSARGGHDIHGLPLISIEVKRQETLNINAWWEQCTRQAANAGLIPVLVYRQSRKEWRVITWALLTDCEQQPAEQWIRAEYSFKDFMLWYEKVYTNFLLSKVNTHKRGH